jgi:phosphoenolpyruvate synthase/pyruvate phosphate dikinase
MKYLTNIHNNVSSNELYGGKGSKLIKMANLGINVPPGFILNTKSYKTFIKQSKFHDKILSSLSHNYTKNEVFTLSKTITNYILNSKIPQAIVFELKKAYRNLNREFGNEISLAVRSSANIEDSDLFSFAGQAETILNNRNLQDIINSLKKCWASLFSPQALLYLLHMRNKGKELSLLDIKIAIIIQKMVFSECSGVLFTANVINNNRDQMLINSTWGLGDAITNNKINPYLIIIDKSNGTIISKIIGEKEQLSKANPNSSSTQLITMDENLRRRCSLNDENIRELYLLGLQLEKYLKLPQDIEWAIEKDELYALQSRPITTLKQ